MWSTGRRRQKVYDTMQQILVLAAPVMVIAHQTNIVALPKRSIQNAWEDAQGNVHLEEARISGNVRAEGGRSPAAPEPAPSEGVTAIRC